MNVLFISIGNKPDYQCDCLFHGLNTLPSVTVYTLNSYWYMYEGNSSSELSKLYGKGFSLTNRIPIGKRHIHSPEEMKENIRNKFYDVVIYGSILRYDAFLEDVLRIYSKNEIIFVDGEDTDFAIPFHFPIKFIVQETIARKRMYGKALQYAKKGLYFKRELREKDRNYFLPVSFAIPEENIVAEKPGKEIELATIIPGKVETYIYHTEEDYYNGYKIAKYGVTTRKGGWDCLRHYEILANACIPYFPDIQKCPVTTMVNFPKDIIAETNALYEKKQLSSDLYNFYCDTLLSYTRAYLTTTSLANYVLSFISK